MASGDISLLSEGGSARGERVESAWKRCSAPRLVKAYEFYFDGMFPFLTFVFFLFRRWTLVGTTTPTTSSRRRPCAPALPSTPSWTAYDYLHLAMRAHACEPRDCASWLSLSRSFSLCLVNSDEGCTERIKRTTKYSQCGSTETFTCAWKTLEV